MTSRESLVQAKGLEILSAFTHSLSGTSEPRFLMDVLSDSLMRHLGAVAGGIQVLDDDWSETGLPPCHIFPGDMEEKLLVPCRERREVLKGSGLKSLVTKLTGESPLPPGAVDDLILLDLPLFSKDSPIGLITLWIPSAVADSLPLRPDLSSEEGDFLSALGREIALRITNLVLHCRADNLVSERQKRLWELWVLQETSNALRGTVELDKILRMILAGATTGLGLGFNRAALFLLNEKSGLLQGMLGVGPDNPEEAGSIWESLSDTTETNLSKQIERYAEYQPRRSRFNTQVKSIRIPLSAGAGALSRCVSARDAVNVGGPDHDPPPERELIDRLSMTSFAATPIVARDHIFGVIAVDNIFDRRPITDDDLRLLVMFAGQAGLAIASARAHLAHRLATEELKTARDQLVQSERLAALGEIAASLAHEIRNPLVSIGGFARRLEKKLHGQEPNCRYAGIIAGEVQRLEQFLEEILLFGQDRRPTLRPVRLESVVDDTVRLFSRHFSETGIAVKKLLPPELPLLMADAGQLRQVFINLFSNASDAMAGGGELTLAVTVEHVPPTCVIMKVSDTGGGVEPEALGNIFNPFYTTKSGGHGLGLALTQRILSEHGGRIMVRNHPGRGLTFVITLPLSSQGGEAEERTSGQRIGGGKG